ncbi:MAG: hypothetical protein V5789_04850 [Colwellia sp.]
MDIFTTQLTRVVPVPIKPANLKVKGPLKEAATGELSEDPEHLENHEYYFIKEGGQYHSSKQESAEQDKDAPQEKKAYSTESIDNTSEQNKQNEQIEDSDKVKDEDKHLDLYA